MREDGNTEELVEVGRERCTFGVAAMSKMNCHPIRFRLRRTESFDRVKITSLFAPYVRIHYSTRSSVSTTAVRRVV